ncbi:MAG TPA: hypothetical protein VIW92_15305, partial [Thermoanaerobaculia bacterium]
MLRHLRENPEGVRLSGKTVFLSPPGGCMRPSQSLVLSLLVSALLASGSAAFAQAAVTNCVPKDQLEHFLRNKGIPDSVVLAFDHLQRTWSGYKWDGNQLDPLRDEIDLKLPFTNK